MEYLSYHGNIQLIVYPGRSRSTSRFSYSISGTFLSVYKNDIIAITMHMDIMLGMCMNDIINIYRPRELARAYCKLIMN